METEGTDSTISLPIESTGSLLSAGSSQINRNSPVFTTDSMQPCISSAVPLLYISEHPFVIPLYFIKSPMFRSQFEKSKKVLFVCPAAQKNGNNRVTDDLFVSDRLSPYGKIIFLLTFYSYFLSRKKQKNAPYCASQAKQKHTRDVLLRKGRMKKIFLLTAATQKTCHAMKQIQRP